MKKTKIYKTLEIILIDYIEKNEKYLAKRLIKKHIPDSKEWDERLFIGILWSVARLITKEGLLDIGNIINNLRKEQEQYEDKFLNQFNKTERPYKAGEIVILYYLCKIVEILNNYLLSTETDAKNKIERLIYKANMFAIVSKNDNLKQLIQYFKDFAINLLKTKQEC